MLTILALETTRFSELLFLIMVVFFIYRQNQVTDRDKHLRTMHLEVLKQLFSEVVISYICIFKVFEFEITYG